ncbi:type II secretion system protein [Duganella sp. FT80W]|uniref:Type II secretion system protein n=1 Tax=Duganella guangzhouensis TaxID=2666084 RepID=A0A6I2L6Z1_9BURK|nr:type II secretion system protein [Duganella guangzhouensis]MRW93583.1 type II secretion system protein [Duganella guangzhouensis]
MRTISQPRVRRLRGLTIIELVIFMVIVGVAAAGILGVINLTNRNNTDPARRKQAMLVAEAYMEELQQAQMTYCDPADANAATVTAVGGCNSIPEAFGPEAGNTRPFDNLNDYVPNASGSAVRAFAVADSSGTLVDRDVAGNALGVNAVGGKLGNVSMSGITTTLSISKVNPANALGTGTALSSSTEDGMAILQITLVVTYGSGANDFVRLDGYRTRYAPRAR